MKRKPSMFRAACFALNQSQTLESTDLDLWASYVALLRRCVGDSSATHQCWAFWKYITTYHIPLEKENNLPTLPKRASKIPKNIQQMLNLSGKGLLNLAPESLTHWPLRILKTWCWEYLGHLFESDIPKTGTPIFMRCSPFCVHTSSMASWSSRWLRRHHSGGTPPQQTQVDRRWPQR